MINIFLNPIKLQKEQGAVTLLVTIVLLILSTLIIIFAANYGMMQEKASANLYRNAQAYEAAEAGLEFGINYLQTNSATIIANPVSGHINYSSADPNITNVTLANNSKFSIAYTNPTANDLTLIKITSTGVNSEGSSTRVVSQLAKFGSTLFSPPNSPIVSQGQVSMTGNATITNTQTNSTILAGSTVSLSGSSQTVISSGTSSTAGLIKSDITQNSTSLANKSQSDFFATYFGNSSSVIKGDMQHVYSNSSDTNYSSTLNGMNGTSVWIDQTNGTATLNGNTTIGTATNPVLLIVNGPLSISGNLTIYGYVFVFGTNTIDSISGNVNITGGIISTVNLSMSGNIGVNYSPTTINNLQNLPSMRYYAKVPGSWKDY